MLHDDNDIDKDKNKKFSSIAEFVDVYNRPNLSGVEQSDLYAFSKTIIANCMPSSNTLDNNNLTRLYLLLELLQCDERSGYPIKKTIIASILRTILDKSWVTDPRLFDFLTRCLLANLNDHNDALQYDEISFIYNTIKQEIPKLHDHTAAGVFKTIHCLRLFSLITLLLSEDQFARLQWEDKDTVCENLQTLCQSKNLLVQQYASSALFTLLLIKSDETRWKKFKRHVVGPFNKIDGVLLGVSAVLSLVALILVPPVGAAACTATAVAATNLGIAAGITSACVLIPRAIRFGNQVVESSKHKSAPSKQQQLNFENANYHLENIRLLVSTNNDSKAISELNHLQGLIKQLDNEQVGYILNQLIILVQTTLFQIKHPDQVLFHGILRLFIELGLDNRNEKLLQLLLFFNLNLFKFYLVEEFNQRYADADNNLLVHCDAAIKLFISKNSKLTKVDVNLAEKLAKITFENFIFLYNNEVTDSLQNSLIISAEKEHVNSNAAELPRYTTDIYPSRYLVTQYSSTVNNLEVVNAIDHGSNFVGWHVFALYHRDIYATQLVTHAIAQKTNDSKLSDLILQINADPSSDKQQQLGQFSDFFEKNNVPRKEFTNPDGTINYQAARQELLYLINQYSNILVIVEAAEPTKIFIDQPTNLFIRNIKARRNTKILLATSSDWSGFLKANEITKISSEPLPNILPGSVIMESPADLATDSSPVTRAHHLKRSEKERPPSPSSEATTPHVLQFFCRINYALTLPAKTITDIEERFSTRLKVDNITYLTTTKLLLPQGNGFFKINYDNQRRLQRQVSDHDFSVIRELIDFFRKRYVFDLLDISTFEYDRYELDAVFSFLRNVAVQLTKKSDRSEDDNQMLNYICLVIFNMARKALVVNKEFFKVNFIIDRYKTIITNYFGQNAWQLCYYHALEGRLLHLLKLSNVAVMHYRQLAGLYELHCRQHDFFWFTFMCNYLSSIIQSDSNANAETILASVNEELKQANQLTKEEKCILQVRLDQLVAYDIPTVRGLGSESALSFDDQILILTNAQATLGQTNIPLEHPLALVLQERIGLLYLERNTVNDDPDTTKQYLAKAEKLLSSASDHTRYRSISDLVISRLNLGLCYAQQFLVSGEKEFQSKFQSVVNELQRYAKKLPPSSTFLVLIKLLYACCVEIAENNDASLLAKLKEAEVEQLRHTKVKGQVARFESTPSYWHETLFVTHRDPSLMKQILVVTERIYSSKHIQTAYRIMHYAMALYHQESYHDALEQLKKLDVHREKINESSCQYIDRIISECQQALTARTTADILGDSMSSVLSGNDDQDLVNNDHASQSTV